MYFSCELKWLSSRYSPCAEGLLEQEHQPRLSGNTSTDVLSGRRNYARKKAIFTLSRKNQQTRRLYCHTPSRANQAPILHQRRSSYFSSAEELRFFKGGWLKQQERISSWKSQPRLLVGAQLRTPSEQSTQQANGTFPISLSLNNELRRRANLYTRCHVDNQLLSLTWSTSIEFTSSLSSNRAIASSVSMLQHGAAVAASSSIPVVVSM